MGELRVRMMISCKTKGEKQFLKDQMLNLKKKKKLLRYVYISTFYHTQLLFNS